MGACAKEREAEISFPAGEASSHAQNTAALQHKPSIQLARSGTRRESAWQSANAGLAGPSLHDAPLASTTCRSLQGRATCRRPQPLPRITHALGHARSQQGPLLTRDGEHDGVDIEEAD